MSRTSDAALGTVVPFRTSKQTRSKQMKKSPESDHSSRKLTFVARFEDGVVTRMSTFCAGGKLDLQRGIAVAHAAHESKTSGNQPPAMVAAKFIEPGYDDTILEEYDAEELSEAAP